MSFWNLPNHAEMIPRPEYDFPGLKAGDGCVCVCTALEKAYDAGVAPPVKAEATHEKALEVIPKHALEKHTISNTSLRRGSGPLAKATLWRQPPPPTPSAGILTTAYSLAGRIFYQTRSRHGARPTTGDCQSCLGGGTGAVFSGLFRGGSG